MAVGHPPVQQSVRQALGGVKSQPAQPCNGLAAAAQMGGAKNRVEQVEDGCDEFKGVNRQGLAGR